MTWGQHLTGLVRCCTQNWRPRIDRLSIETVSHSPIKDPKTPKRFAPPLLLIKEHQDLYSDLWSDGYLTYKNEIVGFSGPGDFRNLQNVANWIRDESTLLQAYVAGISSRLFTQRATSIFNADIFSLPYPENGDIDISDNERIVAEDIVDYQRDFIRLGASSKVMQSPSEEALISFDKVFTSQINAVYTRNPLRPLTLQRWSGAICKAYVFGDGEVDWSDANSLHDYLDALLYERRGSGLKVIRITRAYDRNFLFFLKPDRHRFWTRSMALRDADDVLADLRGQGF